MINTLSTLLDWQTPSQREFPRLVQSEVHLWWLPLELSATEQDIALGWLSDIQRDKYVRRAKAGLQHSYLAGRYFLLRLLGAYTETRPEDVLLSYSRLNKPYISKPLYKSSREAAQHPRNIEFNFTDTIYEDQAYGLYAFCCSGEVGVDIEALNRPRNFKEIAKRRFTEEELKVVGEPINNEDFLAIWTRKEAYGKATGKGINFKMNQRNLVDGTSHTVSFVDEHDAAWQLLQFCPDSDHIAALVYAGDQSFAIKAFNSLNHLP